MKNIANYLIVVAACGTFVSSACAQEINMFNGRDLTGWKGLTSIWSVRDGAITGKLTTKNNPGTNTFIVWQGGEVRDFDFTCKYKLIAENPEGMANSGIQFRAAYINPSKFSLRGYQGEMDPGTVHPNSWPDMPSTNGCFFIDPSSELLSPTGQIVSIHSGNKAKGLANFEVTGSLGTAQSSAASFKKGDWNDYRIVAVGNHIQIYVNGIQTVDATDEGNRYTSGLLGLQIHCYNKGPKVVQFKDLKLRILQGGASPLAGNVPANGSQPNVTTYKPDQPQIKILSEESVNVTGWITSPLDVAVPEQIWENLNFMKEALKDEAAQKPAAAPAAYQIGVRLCLKMLEDLADRDAVTARAGGAAVLHQRSNLTQNQRDHLTWPQYALERDERAERKENARNADKFMNGHIMIEWTGRAGNMRKEIQLLYSQFREALRQQHAK